MDFNFVGNILFRILFICTISVISGLITAKAFYCQDPDTGIMYPVNTTWQSTSFCGRYTCKLRKKSHGNHSTEDNTIHNNCTHKCEFNKNCTHKCEFNKNCTHHKAVITKDKGKADKELFLNKLKNVSNLKNVDLEASTSDGDRYLTEEEVKAVSLLLQTMKKSDLESILEIYRLAQDVYKEIDKIPVEKLSHMTVDDNEKINEKNHFVNEILDSRKNNKISYWYEPLAVGYHKLKETDAIDTSQHQENLKQKSITLMEAKNNRKMFEPAVKSKTIDKPFITGPLLNDYKKIPYYHLLTNFQRQASYFHPRKPSDLKVPISYPQPSGHFPVYNWLQQYMPVIMHPQQQPNLKHIESVRENQPRDKTAQELTFQRSNMNRKMPFAPTYDKRKSNSGEITMKAMDKKGFIETKTQARKSNPPYPQHYNSSNGQIYSSENIWKMFNQSKEHERHQKTNGGNTYLTQLPNLALKENIISREMGEIQDPNRNSKEVINNLADWQTSPLSRTVLREVSANIDKSKFMPYPFKRRIKLDSVDRLLKLEDVDRMRDPKTRVYRQVNTEEYEVYLEKSTCQTDTEPGFFRMGNSSHAFPGCCPERIPS